MVTSFASQPNTRSHQMVEAALAGATSAHTAVAQALLEAAA
jgi:hypothetical protein